MLFLDVVCELFVRFFVDVGVLMRWLDDVVGILDVVSGCFMLFSDGVECFVGVDGFRGMFEELVKYCDVVYCL